MELLEKKKENNQEVNKKTNCTARLCELVEQTTLTKKSKHKIEETTKNWVDC